eukprot:2975723-Rhodomonas_salina.1
MFEALASDASLLGVKDEAWLKLKLGTSKPELARKGKQTANGTISLFTFACRDSVLSMLYPVTVLFNPAQFLLQYYNA